MITSTGIAAIRRMLAAAALASPLAGCATAVDAPLDGNDRQTAQSNGAAIGSAQQVSRPALAAPEAVSHRGHSEPVETPDSAIPDTPPRQPERNLTMKTLGGRQFWGDAQFFHGWRIQQNVFTKHYRLLDEQDYRHASGTLDECRARLAELREQLGLPPMSGRAVVFIHGIIRSSKSFHKMRTRFEQEGYSTFGFDYPSTRVTIPEAAEYLHQCLSSLEGIEEINLVVHSMGGLVVRTYLADHQDPRIRRMVMIGVPNTGAHMADHLKKNLLFRTIFGPAGQQLVSGDEGYIAALPIPAFEFGIIAGSRGTDCGYNPLIPGDDDGTVNIECTRLPGAADFTTVRGLHSFLMNSNEAVEDTVRFIETGRFREGEPTAVPAAEGALPR